MLGSSLNTLIGGRREWRPQRLNYHRTVGRASCAAAVALVASTLCLFVTGVGNAMGRLRQTASSTKPILAASRSDFLAEIRGALKTQHERMIALANRKQCAPVDSDSVAESLLNQQITTESAKSNYRNAVLTREVAELAVKEYTEGIFKQDEATLMGEVLVAQSDLSRKTDIIAELKDQHAKAQRASTGSARDAAVVSLYTERISDAERHERAARIDVLKAKSKLKMLVEFTKRIQMLQLKAEVEAAREEELKKQAIVALETAKEERLAALAGVDEDRRKHQGLVARLITRRPTAKNEDRVLAMLDKGILVDQELRTKLSQVAAEGKLAARLETQMRDLLKLLESIVNEAEAARSDLDIDRLKARIHNTVAQAGDAKG
jgi:hypothetical protein